MVPIFHFNRLSRSLEPLAVHNNLMHLDARESCRYPQGVRCAVPETGFGPKHSCLQGGALQ